MSPSGNGPKTIFEPFRIDGVVIGIISSIEGDPDNLGRVLVNFPTLNLTSNWARVASFFAGPERGAYFPPKVDDEVLIAFELGDLTRPYVIGVLWNGVDQPPVPEESRATQQVIRTGKGLQLKFDDNPDALQIEITDGTGNQFLINTAEKKISIVSTGDIGFTTETGSITLSGTNINLNATAELSLTGSSKASLSSEGEASVSAPMVKLN